MVKEEVQGNTFAPETKEAKERSDGRLAIMGPPRQKLIGKRKRQRRPGKWYPVDKYTRRVVGFFGYGIATEFKTDTHMLASVQRGCSKQHPIDKNQKVPPRLLMK